MPDALFNLRVSPHFSVHEFMCLGETCSCHGAVQVDSKLVAVLEEFRQVVDGPLHVLSGFRCDVHNEVVGGHPHSFHRMGLAADVTSLSLRVDLETAADDAGEILAYRFGEDFGNVIWYPESGFIHIDVGHRIAELVRRKD